MNVPSLLHSFHWTTLPFFWLASIKETSSLAKYRSSESVTRKVTASVHMFKQALTSQTIEVIAVRYNEESLQGEESLEKKKFASTCMLMTEKRTQMYHQHKIIPQ